LDKEGAVIRYGVSEEDDIESGAAEKDEIESSAAERRARRWRLEGTDGHTRTIEEGEAVEGWQLEPGGASVRRSVAGGVAAKMRIRPLGLAGWGGAHARDFYMWVVWSRPYTSRFVLGRAAQFGPCLAQRDWGEVQARPGARFEPA
jgi:hypothetical protein